MPFIQNYCVVRHQYQNFKILKLVKYLRKKFKTVQCILNLEEIYYMYILSASNITK